MSRPKNKLVEWAAATDSGPAAVRRQARWYSGSDQAPAGVAPNPLHVKIIWAPKLLTQ